MVSAKLEKAYQNSQRCQKTRRCGIFFKNQAPLIKQRELIGGSFLAESRRGSMSVE